MSHTFAARGIGSERVLDFIGINSSERPGHVKSVCAQTLEILFGYGKYGLLIKVWKQRCV